MEDSVLFWENDGGGGYEEEAGWTIEAIEIVQAGVCADQDDQE